MLKMLAKLLSWLPLPISQGVGAFVGVLAAWLPNDLRRITARNLSLCFPELTPRARRRLLRRSLREAGKTATEAGALWHWPAQRLFRQVRAVHGLAHVREPLAAGRGVILLAPHLGAWELIGLYPFAPCAMTSLYRPPRMRHLAAWAKQARERFGARLVPTDAAGVKALYRSLAEQGLVGILPDQEPRDARAPFAPFFGVPARTMGLVNRLARKTGAAVVYAYAERLSWGRGYAIHVLPAPPGIDDADPVRAATALNAGVEACVRRLPAQYQWGYKRFKSRPDGAPDVYGAAAMTAIQRE